MPSTPNPITRLFRACDPNESFGPEDARYVNCDAERGTDVMFTFERELRAADVTKPVIRLFAGHSGAGKTSELLRLKQRLEQPDENTDTRPFVVVYFDVGRSLDLNDVDVPDLLVVTAWEIQRQLAKANLPGFDPTSDLLQKTWAKITGALPGGVVPGDASVDVGLGALTVEFRNQPGLRRDLRRQIEVHHTSLLAAVNDLLVAARVSARSAGREGVALLIDGLDKMVLRPVRDGGSTTHERLFVERGGQLAALEAHTIYTVPISLVYSPRIAAVQQVFGNTRPIPMIRLRSDGRRRVEPGTSGMLKMRELLEKRCHAADVDPQDAFDDPATVSRLCEMSGGHPRQLLRFVQASISQADNLPLTSAAVEKAIEQDGNTRLRGMPQDWWSKLRQFDKPQFDVPTDEAYQEMLYLLHIFEYMNGRPWYEVNPVLRTIPQFQRAGRARRRR